MSDDLANLNPEDYIEKCDMDFYLKLGIEAYDVVNIVGYGLFYAVF